MNTTFVRYMQQYGHLVLHRPSMLRMFTCTELPSMSYTGTITAGQPIPQVIPSAMHTPGTICVIKDDKDTRIGYGYVKNDQIIGIEPSAEHPDIPFDVHDIIAIQRGDIANWTGAPGTSTIGRYLLNWLLLASIFDNSIEYVNEPWNIGKIEKLIAGGLMSGKYTMEQYEKYMNHGYFIGHFAELCVPTITRRSFTTDPRIAIRKRELLEQYKGQLEDPNVIAAIETELLAMDKKWIEDDEAYGFHKGIGDKSFNIHRKKMHIAVGGIEAFDDDGGTYNFLPNALSEGWRKEDFPIIANEIRKGSYSRGKETAKGGAMTKFILRVFQDVRITEEDCGTRLGVTMMFEKDILSSLIGRTVYVKDKEVVIAADNVNALSTQEITLRSPVYCQTKNGLCYKCCGNNFKSLGVAAIGPQAVEISSKFMLTSMKLIA